MPQNIPLAFFLGLVATVLLALSATVQHGAVGQQQSGAGEALGGAQLRALLRSPRWWVGMLLGGLGSVLQLVAVLLAPITVVQPLGILAVPWTVLMTSRVSGHRIPGRAWTAVGLVVVGAAWFSYVAAVHAADQEYLDDTRLVSGTLVAFAIAGALALAGARGPVRFRCMAWAAAAGVIYALETGMVKALGEFVATRDWWTEVTFWILAVLLPVGVVLAIAFVQQAYATGPAEVVVGSLNAVLPVCAVAFGVAVLGEGENITAQAALMMLVAAVMSIAGVILLSRFHPGAGSAAPSDADSRHA